MPEQPTTTENAPQRPAPPCQGRKQLIPPSDIYPYWSVSGRELDRYKAQAVALMLEEMCEE